MMGWSDDGAAGETVFSNARLVLAAELVPGSIKIHKGRIAEVDSGATDAVGAIDLDGDYLIPGLIDLHTDNLEKHYQPRKDVFWDPVIAAISHDAQVIAAGITTVFDSLTLGAAEGWNTRSKMIEPMIAGLSEAHDQGLLRADHRLHLRCEVTHPDIVAIVGRHLDHALARFMSLMDHAPGDRQSPDLDRYRGFYLAAFDHDRAALDRHIDDLMTKSRTIAPGNRRALATMSKGHAMPMASHDDASLAHIEEASALGCGVTEFPTTSEAAIAAHAFGLKVLMGAPNLIRGGSHSGNVAAADLARYGKLDMFASDYIPSSMLAAAFKLTEPPYSWPLPSAIQTVTQAPAEAAGLSDRGAISPGRVADLVQVGLVDGRPIVKAVWRQGVRKL